jgi:hypothetical protein
MSKSEEFIKDEKELYGKIFVDISYAIDNISPFLNDVALNKRKYTVRLPHLKKYIDLLNSAEVQVSKESFFDLFKSNKYIALLEVYKHDNSEDLDQLKNCSKCVCLNCTVDCDFDSCLGCKKGSHIASCDHQKINVTLHDNFMLDLNNNNTGEQNRYLVLAVLQDIKEDKKYIVIQSIKDKQIFILYYYTGISEDTYGEISNATEFDYVNATFESVDY